jgi:methionine-rich copper-binding protein CopC
MNLFRIVPVMAALAIAAPAVAHPKLLSSSPAANATTGKISSITLNYSETLLPPLSGVELVMTSMPGMASHAPMPISGLKTNVKSGKTLVVTLARPLDAGTYEVRWHAVAADTHRITGAYAFRVK